jgi:hypothetical protein
METTNPNSHRGHGKPYRGGKKYQPKSGQSSKWPHKRPPQNHVGPNKDTQHHNESNVQNNSSSVDAKQKLTRSQNEMVSFFNITTVL